MKRAALLLIMLALPLAACGGDERKAGGNRSAEGEILQGSTSDAMLPLDTVRSQAPLAPKAVESSKGGDSDDRPDKPEKPKKSDSPATSAPEPTE